MNYLEMFVSLTKKDQKLVIQCARIMDRAGIDSFGHALEMVTESTAKRRYQERNEKISVRIAR